MLKTLLSLFILCCTLQSQAQTNKPATKCSGECCKKPAGNKLISETTSTKPMETVALKRVLACKLTSPELQKRKQDVLASLKEKVLDKSELANGYKYKFEGSDRIFDELVTFIKSERACCDFFTFDLSISDNKSNIALSITGPEGAKEFIKVEMDL